MPTTHTQFIITEGPDDNALFDACKYAFDPRHPDFTVVFEGHWASDVGLPTTLPVTAQITGITYESGSRGMLFVEANLKIGNGRSWKAVGFYDARSRKGKFDPGHLVPTPTEV